MALGLCFTIIIRISKEKIRLGECNVQLCADGMEWQTKQWLTMVKCFSDKQEDSCDAVSVVGVNGSIQQCSLLVHTLVPLQAVGLWTGW